MGEAQRNLSPDERFLWALHDLVLDGFRERFGEAVIGVKVISVVCECWITVLVKQRTPEIEELAAQMERDFQEEGRQIAVFLRRPWKAALREFVRKILKQG